MALSVEQLTTPVTEAEALEQHLDILVSLGFPARSWQSGSVPRTLVQLTARLRANASTTVTGIAKGGFSALAEGGWLTLLSASHYENDRQGAVRTKGDVRLVCASGSGPYTKAAGTVVVKDSVTGQQYRNVGGFTLSSAASVDVLFEADVAGTAGNVADGAINTLVTSMAGVTVNTSGFPSDWYGVTGGAAGAAEETDAELRVRNSGKWATLGIGGPKRAYKTWVLEALPTVTRVGVDDANTISPGVVGVYLADATGGVADAGNVVRDYLLGTDGVGRHPIGPAPTIAAATDVSITPAYVATYDPTYYASAGAAETALDAAIDAHYAQLPVGGYQSPSNPAVYQFTLGSLYAAVVAVPGIINVVLTAPTANVTMAQFSTVAVSGGAPYGTATAVSS